jgi:hypothetical protein
MAASGQSAARTKWNMLGNPTTHGKSLALSE